MAAAKRKPPAGKTSPSGSGAVATAGKKTVSAALARKPSRKVVRDMLILELRRLRAMFTEIAERYVNDAEGGMAAVIETVERKTLSVARLDGMLKIVRGLSIKPRKGRRKDMARIEKVAASIRKELGE
jgi:hypothetical protein